MSPPTLSLEKVLSRSMQMPASRAAKVLSALTNPNPPIAPAVVGGRVEPESRKHLRLTHKDAPSPQHPITTGDPEAVAAEEHARDSVKAEFTRPMERHRNLSQDLTLLLQMSRGIGDWEGATTAFAEALREDHTFVPTSLQLCALTEANLTADGDESFVRRWHTVLLDVLKERQSPTLREDPHLLMVSGFAEAGAWQTALRHLDVMRHHEQPSPLTTAICNAAISACQRVAQWEAAFAVFQVMRDPATPPEAQPDAVTFAAVMSTMEAAGRPAEAKMIASTMPPKHADEVTASYAALIHTWSARHARRSLKRF